MNKLGVVGAIAALVVLFFAINMIGGRGLFGARVDLTEGKLYTLTAGSRKLAGSLSDPITLSLYFSAKGSQGNPGLQSYGQRVREVLEELQRASKGKITLKVVDPVPLSEEEDAAIAAGIAPVPIGARGDNVYLGLVGTNSIDGREAIPFLDPSKERFLEYDLSRLIYSLANPTKKTVGILTALPLEGQAFNPRTMQPQRAQPWIIVNEIKGLFNVKTIEPTVTEIPKDVDVLLLAHPKKLSDTTLYAIDQYVMAGGRLLAFVDPICENDPAGQQDQFGGAGQDKSSDLNKLFNAWGFEVVANQVATDNKLALKVNSGGQTRELVSYVAWLGITKDSMDPKDPITGQLSSINIATSGVIRPTNAPAPSAKEGEAGQPASMAPGSFGPIATVTPLLTTTESSQMIDVARVQFFPQPKDLLNTFAPGNQKLTIAARISGKVKSAFPEGRPAPAPPADGTPPPPPPAEAAHLAESRDSIQAVVVADADMLADMFWSQPETLGPILLGYRKLADNGNFVTNSLDNLIGNEDLISIRARGEFARPFTVVQEMERNAEQKTQARVNLLQQQLDEAERKIGELERQRPEQAQGGGLLLTPEQQAEIRKFRDQQVAARKDLRRERLALTRDIESLHTQLKLVNIGLMPVLVSLAALLLAGYRISRRKAA